MGISNWRRLIPLVLLLGVVGANASVSAGELDDVQGRGAVRCGVDDNRPGFAVLDVSGTWAGFDVDYCRAIAAAVLGKSSAVEIVPVSAKDRFRALQSGKIDVLFRDTAWTMARDTSLGLVFAGANFYDGRGLMVPKSLGVDSALQLTGAKVCVESGSESEGAVATFFSAHNMAYTPVPVANDAEQMAAYASGECNVYSGVLTALYATRLSMPTAADHVILPELLSKEPLGPIILQSDARWFSLVRWVHFALLDAEELGVTRGNVDQMRQNGSAEVRLLLGAEGGLGKDIGVANDWAAKAIAAVGNYGEIFERNVGRDSPLNMPRGLNALWTEGGIQFAPPVH